jgi:cytochrome c biogenesis protein CcmG, thiol:disulfide interchange protein DsbE
MRRGTVTAVLATAALAVGACGSGSGATGDAAPVSVAAGDPLARLKSQANQLLGGGPAAFRRRLAELRGHPIVVNQWASWCGPCRVEFPFFQRLADRYDGRVAFLGVDTKDSRSGAARFIREFPVPFPHYDDGDSAIARIFRGGRGWPTTAFYDRRGALALTHVGAYVSEDKLDADIRRYALRG